MPKDTRLSKKECDSLRTMLYRRGYSAPLVLSRLLLEALLFDDGKFASETFISTRVCGRGKFSALRTKLQNDGFISFNDDSLRHSKYFAGPQILPYLKTLKDKHQSFATNKRVDELLASKADKSVEIKVEALQKDNAEMKARLCKVEEAVKDLIASEEPPITEEKKKAGVNAKQRLAQLALVKAN